MEYFERKQKEIQKIIILYGKEKYFTLYILLVLALKASN